MTTRRASRSVELLVLGGLGVAALLVGCDRDPIASEPRASASHASAGRSSAPEVRPEPYAAEQLPDEADYAAEAEREITGDNYAEKLTEIERLLSPADAGPAGADGGVGAAPPVDGPTERR